MGIDNNIALCRLSENPLQFHHRTAFRLNDVAKYISRPDAWKLVYIPDKDQPRSDGNGLKQTGKQINVDHGHLVNNNYVRFKRIPFVAFKCLRRLTTFFHAIRRIHACPIVTEHTVDCLCLVAGRLTHPLCRTAGRSR